MIIFYIFLLNINIDKEKNNLKNILEDEEIQKIYNGVKSKMFKKAPQHK